MFFGKSAGFFTLTESDQRLKELFCNQFLCKILDTKFVHLESFNVSIPICMKRVTGFLKHQTQTELNLFIITSLFDPKQFCRAFSKN